MTRVIREARALGIDVHVIALRKPDAPPPAERPAVLLGLTESLPSRLRAKDPMP